MSSPHLAFSAAARARNWASLATTEWDLVVIGGGVVGAGAARDAARRGLRVALLEAADWAQGTSSRSSRLIHGGLRYLQTGDLALVFEASAERRRLLDLAPHLVHPLPLLFPVYQGGVGYRKLQAGMWLYDALALFRNIERHRMLGHHDTLHREPGLEPAGLRGGAVFYDAAVDDARLALAVAHAAHRDGATCVSHARVTGFLRDAGGKLAGVRVRDALGPAEIQVRAAAVLNATGPWSDAIRRMADPAAERRLRTTKGVHLVFRRERVGNNGAIIFESAVDGRVMFVLPWGELTYVGTTDTDFEGDPAHVAADAADVDYLLRSVNALYPHAGLGSADVVSTWAGLRPLLAPRDGDGLDEGQTSREHEVWRDPGGLFTIGGGKLTTYRVMAADAVDQIAEALREARGLEIGPSRTEQAPVADAPTEPWEEFRDRIARRADGLGFGYDVGEHLARFYGTAAADVLAAAADDPELGRRLVPGLPYLWAEVVHAVRHEMALTLEDLLARRLHLLYEADDGGLGIAEAVVDRLVAEPELAWDRERGDRDLENYRRTVARDRHFRA